MVWALTTDGCFSNVLAYEFLIDPGDEHNNRLFKIIWRWGGLERYRIHLWKVAQGVLLTNVMRVRRDIASSSTCPICLEGEESIEHVLRDCPIIHHTWLLLGEGNIHNNFFSEEIKDWLLSNLRNNRLVHGLKWSLIFGVAVYCFWACRNEVIFQNKVFTNQDRLRKILGSAHAIQQSLKDHHVGIKSIGVYRDDVGWSPLKMVLLS